MTRPNPQSIVKLVGRAGHDPATYGLKVRAAVHAICAQMQSLSQERIVPVIQRWTKRAFVGLSVGAGADDADPLAALRRVTVGASS